MAHYRATLETTRPREEVFDYLSDFSTAREWDPGTSEAERLSDQVDLGTEFRLLARFLGRKTEITYRIVEYNPPELVVFKGENSTVTSLDTLTFESATIGTRITYGAELSLNGPLRIASPLLQVAFNRVGERALRGLKRMLARPGPLTPHRDDAPSAA